MSSEVFIVLDVILIVLFVLMILYGYKKGCIGIVAKLVSLIIAFVLVIVTKIILDLYLKTKSGFLLRAVGNNDILVTSLAKDTGLVKIVGLAIANGLVSMSGAIMCQQQRFFDITMGTGAVVIALASVIIGTSLFKNLTFMKATTIS